MSMRPGNRKARKSIAIIGEGLTEYRYVDDMRTTERYRFSLVPGIPKHSDVDDIVNLANKTHIYRELKEKGNMERAIEMSRELDKLHETEPEVYKSYTQMYKLFDIIREIMK